DKERGRTVLRSEDNHGAVVEQSGRNQPQWLAKGAAAETAQTLANRRQRSLQAEVEQTTPARPIQSDPARGRSVRSRARDGRPGLRRERHARLRRGLDGLDRRASA